MMAGAKWPAFTRCLLPDLHIKIAAFNCGADASGFFPSISKISLTLLWVSQTLSREVEPNSVH